MKRLNTKTVETNFEMSINGINMIMLVVLNVVLFLQDGKCEHEIKQQKEVLNDTKIVIPVFIITHSNFTKYYEKLKTNKMLITKYF